MPNVTWHNSTWIGTALIGHTSILHQDGISAAFVRELNYIGWQAPMTNNTERKSYVHKVRKL